jgi:hypothetical protein
VRGERRVLTLLHGFRFEICVDLGTAEKAEAGDDKPDEH